MLKDKNIYGMGKKEKIIFIDVPGKKGKEAVWEDDQDSDYFYHQGWSTQVAKLINKKTDLYDIEIWRIDSRVTKARMRTVEGITCRIFPGRDLFGIFPYSKQFFKKLKWELKNNRVLIHMPGFNHVFNLVVGVIIKKTPIIVHQTGGANPLWRFQRNRKMKSWLYSFCQRKLFIKKIVLAYLVGDEDKKYLGMELEEDKLLDITLQPIDFALFYRHDKIKSREKLALPLDKKIILQPYRASTSDGSGITIDAWKEHLEKKGILLYMINIHESNELYQKVVDSGIEFRGRYRLDEMPYWYSAVDLVIYPSFDEELVSFGGVGYSVFESLACGTPVVGTTLKSFPNFKNEEANIKRICRIPDQMADVAPMVLDLLENPSSSSECRDLVYKYLNEDYIAANYLGHVRELFAKFY